MSHEDETVHDNLDDAMKYKLLKFFSTMSLSSTQIQSIEEAVSSIMDMKIEEHKKKTGERLGDIEKNLIEIKHELLNKIKDVTAAQEVKDTKQDSFINGLKTLMAWVIPVTIGALVTWFFARK